MLARSLLLQYPIRSNNPQAVQPIDRQSNGARRNPARRFGVPFEVARHRGAIAATIALQAISSPRVVDSSTLALNCLRHRQEQENSYANGK